MKTFFKKLIKFFLGKKIGQKFFRFLFVLGLKGMNFGGGADTKESGEDFVVKYALSKLRGKSLVVFDVGGNFGEYTALWLEQLTPTNSGSFFYIFEPSNKAFSHLQEKFVGKSNIKLLNRAVSNVEGEAVLYSDFAGSGLASLAKRDLSHVGLEMSSSQTIKTITLDKFCEEQKISNVDFLKLDIEGYEYLALKGAEELLQASQIKFIQFEFGGTDVDTRIFFRDFYLLLAKKYRIYRILKNGLEEINKYSELEEIFATTNYLAELKN